jgi:hypothetical protein
MPSRREIRRAEQLLARWRNDGTALDCLTAVYVSGTGPKPTAIIHVRGQFQTLIGWGVVVSPHGSLMIVPDARKAEKIEIETDWKGNLLTLKFENAFFFVADYEIGGTLKNSMTPAAQAEC